MSDDEIRKDGREDLGAEAGAGQRGWSDPASIWAATQGAALLLVLGFFLQSVQGVLSPLLLFVLLIAVLLPFRHFRGHTVLLTLTGLLTALWLFASAGAFLAPFVLAAVLAYILDPVVDWMEGKGIGRTPAILILVVPFIAVVAAGLFFGVPALGRQFADFVDGLPNLVGRLQRWAAQVSGELESLPVFGEELSRRISQLDADALVGIIQDRQQEIASRAWDAVLGFGRGIGLLLSLLGYGVLTPVLTFYLLRDWNGIVSKLDDLLPRDRRDQIVGFTSEYDGLLGRYLRGQLTVALTIGVITAIGLWIVSFPYAALIGALVAIFSVVPYLGLILSLVPAVIVALTTDAIGLSLVKVFGVFAVAQGLEGTVIAPRIVGDSVGLHPVWVVLALSAGGFYLGFVGLLLGVPIAVGIKLLVLRALERYRRSEVFRGG